MDVNEFGAVIRRKRIEKNYTQKQLADRLSVTDKVVSNWEHGLCFPDPSVYKSLAETLDIPVESLVNYGTICPRECVQKESAKKYNYNILIVLYIAFGIAVYFFLLLHPAYLIWLKRIYKMALSLVYFGGLTLCILYVERTNNEKKIQNRGGDDSGDGI